MGFLKELGLGQKTTSLQKRPFFQKEWGILLVTIFLFIAACGGNGGGGGSSTTCNTGYCLSGNECCPSSTPYYCATFGRCDLQYAQNYPNFYICYAVTANPECF